MNFSATRISSHQPLKVPLYLALEVDFLRVRPRGLATLSVNLFFFFKDTYKGHIPRVESSPQVCGGVPLPGTGLGTQ